MSQKNGSFSAVVKREFLTGLPLVDSKVIQVILLPLALYVESKKNYNDLYFSISKAEMVEVLGWPKSYKEEGHFNQLLCRLVDEIARLKVDGTRIVKSINSPRGLFEIEFTQEGMDKYFQGISKNFLSINLDTIQKMKNQDTWNFIKDMMISYDFTNSKPQQFLRHTKTLKERFGLSIDDYMVETTGKFDRTKFEKRRIYPIITDIQSMKQFELYPAEYKKKEPVYLGKTYKSGKYIDNYFINYKINKI